MSLVVTLVTEFLGRRKALSTYVLKLSILWITALFSAVSLMDDQPANRIF